MDQNCTMNEAFYTSHRQPHVLAPAISRISMTSRPAQAAPATHFAHSNPSLGNPVTMDIDVPQKAKANPDTC